MKTPYDHVPVPTEPVERGKEETGAVVRVKGRAQRQHVVTKRVSPTLHHGANPDQGTLLSGELRCTLIALSPLLVANQHVEVAKLGGPIISCLTDVRDGTKSALNALATRLPPRNNFESPQALEERKAEEKKEIASICSEFERKKKVLFPLQFGSEATAPVVIPGEGLKGMIQHVVGSLAGTPLDRVGEAMHSYRPNANFPPDGPPLRTIPIAGRVVEDMQQGSLDLEIEPIVDIGKIEWVHGKPLMQDGTKKIFNCGEKIPAGTIFSNKRLNRDNNRSRWKDRGNGPQTTGSQARLLRVRFGLDKNSELYRAHNNRLPLQHKQALVPMCLFAPGNLKVDAAVVRQFLLSREHAVSQQSDTGHMTKDHPLAGKIGKNPEQHPLPEKDDLIFFELRLPKAVKYCDACKQIKDGSINLADCRIVSCGQNYYYRWMHAESVKNVTWGWDGKSKHWKTEPRAEFDPWGPAADGTVDALQNMFGYVMDDKTTPPVDDKPRSSLAGRISVNYALERVAPDAQPEDRFIAGHGNSGFAVFLHPLAAPKGPSWAKGYVPGNEAGATNQPLRTLGDGILHRAAAGDREATIEIQNLATSDFGRKHYLHHKETLGLNAETGCGRAHFDLQAFIAAREKNAGQDDIARQIERRKPLVSDQAGIALRISRPGIAFGFTVRFKDLHPGELGLLVLALNPDLIVEALEKVDSQAFRSARGVCQQANSIQEPSLPGGRRFGLRLGHGKPLGMGSVAVNIDAALLWRDEDSEEQKEPVDYIVEALKEPGRLPDEAVAATLKVLKLDCDAQSYLSQELVVGGKSELDRAKAIRKDHSSASRRQGFGD